MCAAANCGDPVQRDRAIGLTARATDSVGLLIVRVIA
jgi:hypothetical protein